MITKYTNSEGLYIHNNKIVSISPILDTICLEALDYQEVSAFYRKKGGYPLHGGNKLFNSHHIYCSFHIVGKELFSYLLSCPI